MRKIFYVYVHKYASGPKKGQVFYVGKGSQSRYSRPSSRSLFWNRIVEKYGFIPEKVKFFKSEQCALTFEKILIKHYGRNNLCNLTDGGDGATNIPTEVRKRKSDLVSGYGHNLFDWDEHCFIHVDGTVFVGYRYDFCRSYNISNVNAFRLVKRERGFVKGWMILDSKPDVGHFLPPHMKIVREKNKSILVRA